MKHSRPGSLAAVVIVLGVLALVPSSAQAQSNVLYVVNNKVGINLTAPLNLFDVAGNAAIGAGYAGVSAAPTNGLIVQGFVGIGKPNPGQALDVTGNIAASGTISGSFSGNLTGNVTGALTGNVTGNVSGNAGTVTNGLYSTGSYADPPWLTSLDASKLVGTLDVARMPSGGTWSLTSNLAMVGSSTDTAMTLVSPTLYPSFTASGTGSIFPMALVMSAYPRSAAASGYQEVSGLVPQVFRNEGSGNGDTGWINKIMGSNSAVGHLAENAANAPHTHQAIGFRSYLVGRSGTIDEAIDFYQQNDFYYVPGTFTKHYIFLSEDTGSLSVFAGKLRAGGTSDPVEALDVTGNANVSGGYKVGGTAGMTTVVTVRNAGGTADCTMTFTGGILTATTCNHT
jgi:hypothetical protein